MSSSNNRDEILEKIRKLQRHADSAAEIGSEAEAQAFAAKVQELLTAYKLSAADIGSGHKAEESVNITYFGWKSCGLKVRKARVPWAEQLARLVSRAYYCEFVISLQLKETLDGRTVYSEGGIGILVGADTDRTTAVWMFTVLARFLENLAEREYNKAFYARYNHGGDVSEVRGFRAGFVFGFLQRLGERFEEEIRKAESGAQSAGSAIVLVRKNSLSKVHDYMRDSMRLKMQRGRGLSDGGNGLGKQKGRSAADSLDLGRKAVGGAAGRNQLS